MTGGGVCAEVCPQTVGRGVALSEQHLRQLRAKECPRPLCNGHYLDRQVRDVHREGAEIQSAVVNSIRFGPEKPPYLFKAEVITLVTFKALLTSLE